MASISSEHGEGISLNIMPMLDIFSILILFLLMNFSSDPMSHDVKDGITIPESITLDALDEIPNVTVTKTEIFVNDKKVSSIADGDVIKADRHQGAIFPLFNELKKMEEAAKRVAKEKNIPEEESGTITLEMDKSLPFKIMKRVMLSGEQTNYIKFKLAVSKELN